MIYVEIEKIWEKFPNKYLAVLKSAKESRKLLESQKIPSSKSPHSNSETTEALGGTKSSTGQETSKRRGRNIKDLTSKNESVEDNIAHITITDKVVVAEIQETNPYIAGLKRVLRFENL